MTTTILRGQFLTVLALATAAAMGLAAGDGAVAQPTGNGTPMEHRHGTTPTAAPPQGKPDTGPSAGAVIAAYQAAYEKMHREMAVQFTGDADRDFVAGMIPHHQGAIDMAEIVLQYGKDPEIRKLAEEIVAAQQKEIAQMKAWLANQTKPR